ncbi:MAG: HK97 family phage prohead protease [Rhodospirillales bacterium]|nr:HK97 family phage prohead protease [Rhodospirillales bacterium]
MDTLQGIITGYASAFNIIDSDQDIVLPGAFQKTLAEQGPQSKQPRIKFLYMHDSTRLLGVPSVLREDPYGLYFEVPLADTPLARDVLTLYAEKVLTEHSIGYEVVEATWDRAQHARLLKQVKLFEFSCVTWGAQPQTPVISIKSLAHPSELTALADRASRIDSLLHTGSLHSDALCEALDRELKALHTALAPADASDQPYTIQGVIETMTDLATRLQSKAATDDDKAAQEARAKKYGIGIKDGGNVTKPSAWKDVPDEEWGDPVNYKLPMPDKSHADNAASRFGQEATRSQYTKDEQAIIDKRIAARQKALGESEDGKGANMNTRLIKGSGGELAVSEDGTHAKYTGTHTHSHTAMGSQGNDAMHEHEHTHEDDAAHGHAHENAPTPKAAMPSPDRKTPDGRMPRKARDFDTLFQSLNAADELQDDWGDTFIAFTHAMAELMMQAQWQANGWLSDNAEPFNAQEAAQANLDAFGKAVMSLVARSLAADFAPCLDDDGDQFLDPDGCNADDDDDDDDWKARRRPLAMPAAPAPLRKAGRAIGSANRTVITEALDGMSEAMKAMKMHHGAIADLMTKTDPDHVRQDEDTVLGDDDTPNGGTNPNKGRTPAPDRRTAGTTPGLITALDADLMALRRMRSGGKG